MSGIPLLFVGVLLAVSTALAADQCLPAVLKIAIPGTPNIVVVAEGQFEPKSAGSYSLRVYAETNPRFPYDDFVTGTVRSRNGTVEDVRFSDLDRDGSPDIIVVLRSAGTGGYLSADAFRFRGTVLILLGSVSGLPRDADPIRALEAELANRTEPRAAPDADMPRR
jgi:hypothetical protein